MPYHENLIANRSSDRTKKGAAGFATAPFGEIPYRIR